TSYEVVRCNRDRYLNRFTGYFNFGLKNHPGLPQVCLIFGRIGQSHDTLVKRIYREVIKPRVEQEPVHNKEIDVSWPDPLGDLESQKEDLQIELSLEYAGKRPDDYPPTFPATEFAALEKLYRFVIVQHT